MATTPSIAMIPSGYKAGTLYSVLPTNGGADLDIVRGTTATRVNENGLIDEVAVNVPRLDYTDGGCPKLLLEPQSQNLVPYTEDFTQATWGKTAGGLGSAPIVTSNQGISPKGDLTADRAVFSIGSGVTSSDSSNLLEVIAGTIDVDYTFSIYLKSNDENNYTLRFGDSNGTVNSIIVTEQWQRFEVTSNNATTSKGLLLQLRGGATSSTADILIWGAQLEQKSYATSYIPNLTTTLNIRNADVVSKSGLSNYINSSEGVLYLNASALVNGGDDRQISISDGSSSNRVSFQYNVSANLIVMFVFVGGVVTETLTYNVSDSTNVSKFALNYKSNDCSFYIDGVKVDFGTSFSGFSGTLDTLSFDRGIASSIFHGNIKELRVYKEALTDAELIELTR